MRRRRGALVAAALAAAALVGAPAAHAGPAMSDGCVFSVPEPGTTKPVPICFTVFRPDGADAAHRVPLIIDSHGWAGSRMRDPGPFGPLLDAGFGVLSFDQRGFGQS